MAEDSPLDHVFRDVANINAIVARIKQERIKLDAAMETLARHLKQVERLVEMYGPLADVPDQILVKMTEAINNG